MGFCYSWLSPKYRGWKFPWDNSKTQQWHIQYKIHRSFIKHTKKHTRTFNSYCPTTISHTETETETQMLMLWNSGSSPLTCWSFSLRSESSFSVSLSFLVFSAYWVSSVEARPASVLTSDFILLMYRRATVNSSSSFSPAPGLGCNTRWHHHQ